MRADNIRPYGWRFVGADIIRPKFPHSNIYKLANTRKRATCLPTGRPRRSPLLVNPTT